MICFRAKSTLATLLALCCLSGTVAVGLSPTESTVTELAPGVFFRKAQTEPTFTGCNQGWIIFKDFVLVIDANFPGQAKQVIQLIGEQTDKPIRYVFDTHHHGDHADGNSKYVRLGAAAIASERSRVMFDTNGAAEFEKSQNRTNMGHSTTKNLRSISRTDWSSTMARSVSNYCTWDMRIPSVTPSPGCPAMASFSRATPASTERLITWEIVIPRAGSRF